MTAWPEVAAAGTRRRDDVLLIAAATTGVTLSALAVAVVLASEQPGDRSIIALASALAVAVPVLVGIGVWHAGEYVRFGRLLVAWGLVDFLAVLSYSSDSAVYSLGRIGVWVVEPVAIATMLAFPSGRLRGTVERWIVVVISATVAVLFVPTAFLVDTYPEPSFWATCQDDCPENAFMVVATEPAFVDAWVRPLRELITIAVYVAVVGVLYRRLRASTDLGKRMVAPVLTVAIVRSLAIAGGLALRRAAPASVALDVASWIFVLCLPALALAFFIGILRSRLLAGNALQRLALGLRHQTEAEDLRDVLASALEDPSLEVAYWIPDHPGRWVDAAGKDVQLPVGQPGRCVTVVRERDRQLAAFIHDPALREQRPFVEAAGSFAASALENQRLRAQVDASLESLRASRARIQAAADSERRRIERDLHDGAQQRLAALRVRLDLAAEAVAEDPKQGALLLRELGEEVEDALDDVRSLARGIYPALLADRGVEEALQAAARRSPVAATVTTRGLGRYPPEIEAAVYFCCLEALQNVAKHARGATSASVTVVDDGALRFDVRDDGSGFVVDSVLEGTGLANMRDRVGAVGGKLTISSRPGAGTHVAGVIPLPQAGRPVDPRLPVEGRSPG